LRENTIIPWFYNKSFEQVRIKEITTAIRYYVIMTPVPQPLSVVNNVKAKDGKR